MPEDTSKTNISRSLDVQYAMPFPDFAAIAIEELRGRRTTAFLKKKLVQNSREQFLNFID